MSVQEILAAIDALPEPERRKLYAELSRKEQAGPKAKPSAHDLAQHLIGSGSGLHDVSANKGYLDDFGSDSCS